jgi:hypothetical protein
MPHGNARAAGRVFAAAMSAAPEPAAMLRPADIAGPIDHTIFRLAEAA